MQIEETHRERPQFHVQGWRQHTQSSNSLVRYTLSRWPKYKQDIITSNRAHSAQGWLQLIKPRETRPGPLLPRSYRDIIPRQQKGNKGEDGLSSNMLAGTQGLPAAKRTEAGAARKTFVLHEAIWVEAVGSGAPDVFVEVKLAVRYLGKFERLSG